MTDVSAGHLAGDSLWEPRNREVPILQWLSSIGWPSDLLLEASLGCQIACVVTSSSASDTDRSR
jgi:hypothetical protein